MRLFVRPIQEGEAFYDAFQRNIYGSEPDVFGNPRLWTTKEGSAQVIAYSMFGAAGIVYFDGHYYMLAYAIMEGECRMRLEATCLTEAVEDALLFFRSEGVGE